MWDSTRRASSGSKALLRIERNPGLPNRRAALNELARGADWSPGDQRPAAIVLLDLHLFEQLNYTLGYQAGDNTLRHVAHFRRRFLRTIDHVRRSGSEEFLVGLPEVDEALAIDRAERRRLRLIDVGVTAAFGVAEVEAADTVTSWVRRADDAMWVAKREGRNTVRVALRTGGLRVERPRVLGAS